MKTPLERATTKVEQQYKRNPEAVQLAKLASLAVRVEPHLLRRLRLDLLPDADVGIEADLWFGPLVESRGVHTIVLNRYVVELLRENLAEDRQLLLRVIAVTEQAHAEAATTIRLEERLTAIAVLNEPDAAEKINEALLPALRTMQVGGENARQLAHWVLRALPQAHPRVRESLNAIALGLSATLALGGRPILREVPKVPGDLGDMSWLLQGAISVPPTRIGVELVADGVAFVEPGGGHPQLELPATNPLVLSLAWKADGGDAQMLVEAVPGRTVEIDAGVTEVELRTLSGDEYLLSAVSTVESGAETTSEDEGPRHFDIDVFISYAAVDNQKLAGDKGWVTVFHEALERRLRYLMGRAVNTWMYPKLSGADDLMDEGFAQLSKSAVMVSILTTGYLNSEWCIREVNEFCRVAEQTGGVTVDNKSRVFKVIKSPLDQLLMQRLPPNVLDTVGYEFFKIEDGIPRELDFENREKESFREFLVILDDVAHDVAQMLSLLSAEAAPPPPAEKLSGGIFVSYRREDSSAHAGRLYDKLVDHFGKDRIFTDVHSRPMGADSFEEIKDAVGSCDVLLAIIGKDWLSDKRLLHDPRDHVHLEIAHALQRGIRVIPVLVQGTRMPNARDLPDDLANLVYRQAIELSDSRWGSEVDQLVIAIERMLDDQEETVPQSSGVPEPELPTDLSDEERGQHNDARRFARLLVSEIKTYNEQKVTEGRSANDLYERVRDYIDRSREMYDKRVAPAVAARYDYFHAELVNTLAEGDVGKLGPGYPGARVAARRYGVEQELPVEVDEEERQLHIDARRFARLLVSEIKLFNEQKVTEGRRENDLYARLREYIDRSREMYDKRVAPAVAAHHDYFHEELLNTLAEGDVGKLGPGYPGPRVALASEVYEEESRVPNFDEAVENLRSAKSADERVAAARALGVVGSQRGTPHLMAAMFDEDVSVRHAAEEALAQIEAARSGADADIQNARGQQPQSSTEQPPGIFVCYRRDDSPAHAGRLFDNLVSHYHDRVFMDVDAIQPGEDFVKVIENAVSSCAILIVMIGRRWLSAANGEMRRLDDRYDFVRLEIAHALQRGIRVIPVLVQGASMPSLQDLPDDLAKLAYRNAIELSDVRWRYDVDQLIRQMDRILAVQEETIPRGSRFSEPELPIEGSDEEGRLQNDARRFARLLVSEISTYYEKDVKKGRSKNNLYERLQEVIDRSRQVYDRRVASTVAARHDYFHEELVNTLAEGDIRKLGPDYPGASVQTEE